VRVKSPASVRCSNAWTHEARRVIERWNQALAAWRGMLWSPTIRAAPVAAMPWMDVYCAGCCTCRVIDIRTIDRHPLASVGSLVLGLRCSWCNGLGANASDHRSSPIPAGDRVALTRREPLNVARSRRDCRDRCPRTWHAYVPDLGGSKLLPQCDRSYLLWRTGGAGRSCPLARPKSGGCAAAAVVRAEQRKTRRPP
jgi:hypothetical protein